MYEIKIMQEIIATEFKELGVVSLTRVAKKFVNFCVSSTTYAVCVSITEHFVKNFVTSTS